MEIGVFLRYLRCFSKIENVQINEKSVQLMEEADSIMRQLVQNAQIIGNSTKNDVDFIFGLNENQYELQRNILCRKCCVSEIVICICIQKKSGQSKSVSTVRPHLLVK